MHDIKDLRKNVKDYQKKFLERNFDFKIDEFENLDSSNRKLINKKEKLEQEKKILSKSKEKNNFEKSKKISEEILSITKLQNSSQEKLNKLLHILPNIALKDVPVGKDEKANTVITQSGNIKKFSFRAKSHTEIGLKNKDIDFELSTKLSGSRFVILKNKIALLERALINFMLDMHTEKFRYTEVSPPLIVNEEAMFGTGQLPKFEEDQFEIKFDKTDKRKFLIPTAEVVLTNIVRKTVINKDELPQRFVASTPCFRKEAGSYGKDTKGMMRQHQFYKVELVSIVEPSECEKELDRMLNCAKTILEKLELPYQVVLLSTGDMGFSSEKTFDLEVWIPSENKYREISSCSSCGTFQARRMGAKYQALDGKKFVATLNGSGLAVGRLIISILENYQNEDGSVTIPDVLKKYMKNSDKI